MSATITIGAWAIPLAITIGLLAWAVWNRPHERVGGWMDGVETFFRIPVATTLSLIAWLIWALVT